MSKRRSAIAKEVEATLSHPDGPAGRIRELEIAAGFHVIAVGARFPFHFHAGEWHPDSIISQNGKEIRIVLVSALLPGSGAFRRLVQAISRAGFTPVVCAPIGQTMPAIMEKWGWVRSLKPPYYGFDAEEEWRPKS